MWTRTSSSKKFINLVPPLIWFLAATLLSTTSVIGGASQNPKSAAKALSCKDALAGNEFSKLIATIDQFLESPERLNEIGDKVHRVWQNANAYRSRYKPVQNESGEPITDLEKYFTDRQLDSRLKRFFRKNRNGEFEEDIKHLRNSELAPNNSGENYLGGIGYLKAIREFLIYAGDSRDLATEAPVLLGRSLQSVHDGWLERNDWAQESTPHNVNDLNANQQYNNFATFKFLLAELVTQPENHKAEPLLKAVNEEERRLINLRFADYTDMDPGQTYLAMSQVQNVKLNLRDPGLADKFDSMLSRIPFPHKLNDESVEQIFRQSIAKDLPQIFEQLSNIRLIRPSTAPGSGAIVYIIKNIATDEIMGVLKVQSREDGGLDEILSSLAIDRLMSSMLEGQSTNVSHIWSYGKIGNDHYYLVQEPAKTADLNSYIRDGKENLAAKVAAEALALVHGPMSNSNNKEALRVFQGNSYYDISVLRAQIDDISLPESLYNQVSDYLQAYDHLVEIDPIRFAPTLNHGDAHGGNAFFNQISGQTTLIDYGSMTYSVSSQDSAGTGDRGNDLGRMYAYLCTEMIKLGYPTSKALALGELFFHTYVEKLDLDGDELEALKISTRFYFQRYMVIQLNDTEGKIFKPLDDRSLEQLRLQFFELWESMNDYFR